jgi:hypothetical protein
MKTLKFQKPPQMLSISNCALSRLRVLRVVPAKSISYEAGQREPEKIERKKVAILKALSWAEIQRIL